MIRSVNIEGFRCFEHFEMRDLARVNLFVGKNGSGKTTLLEALGGVVTADPVPWVFSCLLRRGEVAAAAEKTTNAEAEYEVAHLFHGHRIERGATFRITAGNSGPPSCVRCEIAPENVSPEDAPFGKDSSGVHYLGTPISLSFESAADRHLAVLSLTDRGGLKPASHRGRPPRWLDPDQQEIPVATFVPFGSLGREEVVSRWQQVALNPEEGRVVEALRVLDAGLEQVAFIPGIPRDPRDFRGGLVVRLAGIDNRIPMGSLGDGMWRLLGLALAMCTSPKGVLLVDEIDAGLHYSVMHKMWEMVLRTAERLDIQVFATTHSRDCVEALADACGQDSEADVSLQRIEPEKGRAVAYSANMIRIAAERDIEVR